MFTFIQTLSKRGLYSIVVVVSFDRRFLFNFLNFIHKYIPAVTIKNSKIAIAITIYVTMLLCSFTMTFVCMAPSVLIFSVFDEPLNNHPPNAPMALLTVEKMTTANVVHAILFNRWFSLVLLSLHSHLS